MIEPVNSDFYLPPEIFTPCDAPGYQPAYTGHQTLDLNLVVEGGALRGIFAAGVMDFLMDMGVWAKNLIGVSAGSLCGYNYVSGERGRTCYVNVRMCTDWRYLSFKSFLVTGNAYGVRFAFHEVPEKYCVSDTEGFRNSPCNLIAVVTNLETGKAEYKHIVEPVTDWPILRASSAMPFVSQTVKLDDGKYLDGGVADAIPVDFSRALGAEKHLVLLTQDRDFVKKENRLFELGRIFYHNYPRFCDTMESRHLVYNDVRARIEKMHEAGEIYAIYPPTRPEVSHMETDRIKVFDLYMEGWLEAQRQWPQIKAYLEI